MIILICGYPGVGKTTLANELAHLINAVILSTDQIRKELLDKPSYSVEEKRLIYDVLLLISKYIHNAGVSCILDATFNEQKSRDICPEGLGISRLQNRKNDYSDADLTIYKRIKEIYEPIKEKHITVDTSQPLKEIVSKVVNKIQDYEP